MLVFFFLLWIILNGRFTLELALLGIVIAAAVFAFSHAVFGYSLVTETDILRNIPLMIVYILNLILEIIKAALAVMKVVITGRRPDPVIIEFHSGLKDEVCNVFLANSITLTPGTYTIFQEGDHFKVHCLMEEFSEGMEESSFVRLLRKVRVSRKEGERK